MEEKKRFDSNDTLPHPIHSKSFKLPVEFYSPVVSNFIRIILISTYIATNMPVQKRINSRKPKEFRTLKI